MIAKFSPLLCNHPLQLSDTNSASTNPARNMMVGLPSCMLGWDKGPADRHFWEQVFWDQATFRIDSWEAAVGFWKSTQCSLRDSVVGLALADAPFHHRVLYFISETFYMHSTPWDDSMHSNSRCSEFDSVGKNMAYTVQHEGKIFHFRLYCPYFQNVSSELSFPGCIKQEHSMVTLGCLNWKPSPTYLCPTKELTHD